MKNIFKEVKVLTSQTYSDKRGVFFESFGKNMSDALNQTFTQDNHSYSHKNVIRGLHYQWDSPMGKLVRVAKGVIIDYFVDIRKDSPTYGQYDSILLSDENRVAIWVPPGLAHGFEVLADDAIVLYKCTAYYNKDGESGINPFDKEINIPWQTPKEKMIVSDRDLKSQTFAEYSMDPKF